MVLDGVVMEARRDFPNRFLSAQLNLDTILHPIVHRFVGAVC